MVIVFHGSRDVNSSCYLQ